MATRNLLILPSLTLLSCLCTVAGGGAHAGFLRGEYLRQVERDLRLLATEAGKLLPECPGTSQDLYYDANITIQQYEDDEVVCDDEDMVYVGLELEKIVKELERIYPEYSNEWLDTKVCAVPHVEVAEEEIVGDGGEKPTDGPETTEGPVGKAPTDNKDNPMELPSKSPTNPPTNSSAPTPTENMARV